MGVVEPETPVWYADSDDPYYTLKAGGGWLVAVAFIPTILVFCAAGGHAPALTWLVPGLLVPMAAVAAAWEWLADRRAVVEMRLAGGTLTVIRANGTRAAYPVSSIDRIEQVRRIRGGLPSSSRMRLHIGSRTERTRSGPADLPSRWAEAVTIAEIETTVQEKIENDD